jgi:hypothetical protein
MAFLFVAVREDDRVAYDSFVRSGPTCATTLWETTNAVTMREHARAAIASRTAMLRRGVDTIVLMWVETAEMAESIRHPGAPRSLSSTLAAMKVAE